MFSRIREAFYAGLIALGVTSLAALAQQVALPNNVQFQGHYIAGASAPPTGTGCTIAAGSTDTDGSCTASAASGSIAFASAYASAPSCILIDASTGAAYAQTGVYTTTTSQITLSTIVSTHVYFWHCAAKIGG